MSLVKKAQAAKAARLNSGVGNFKNVVVVDRSSTSDKTVTHKTLQPIGAEQASFEIMKAAIEADLAQLKTFNTLEDKDEYKSDAIKQNGYLDYCKNYQHSGANHPNIILAWVFIWLIDLQRYTEAFAFLPLLIAQGQKLPTRFKTPHWGEFVIDQIYDVAVDKLSNIDDISAEDLLNITERVSTLIRYFNEQAWALNPIVAGKLFSVAGKLEQQQHNYGRALRHFLQATLLNDSAGVKKAARELAKKIDVEINI
ncbi:phage terminase small subunit [Shewanella surugensis]|uniref:Phage terminase small subunit n=1 Tax=Shewanella surugensis TaxID=212020 RepID=A0ABT0L6W8_9GAMM|nr:phage terminase small subunit [Shewanella surugensis]MCL1123309.1 phage terminase small subunit [Shewanella surugensis]